MRDHPGESGRIERTDDEWRARLTEEQFRITRRKGTERAFTGAYHDTRTPGRYHCVCCGEQLFSSEAKYDSGSGWPSFTRPADAKSLHLERDVSLGMVRTEVMCARCDAHLGHVFPDGPSDTGQRYCINSAALELRPEEE